MKEELFHAISEIDMKTDETVMKPEIDRTYAMVMKKIRHEERKQHKKKKIVGIIAASISVAAVIGILIFPKNNTTDTLPDSSGQIMQKTAEKEEPSNTAEIVVYVYEAQTKSQPVTNLYASEMVKKEVKANTTIYLGSYNPAMSSVPGYPMIVSNAPDGSGQKRRNTIRIKTDKGSLISWDRNTGKIAEIGKEGLFEPGDNIYWSPLDDSTPCKLAEITADLLEDKNKIATTKIIMKKQDTGIYTAEKMN